LDTNDFRFRAVTPQLITCRDVVIPERCPAKSNLWTSVTAATKLAADGVPPLFLPLFYRQRNYIVYGPVSRRRFFLFFFCAHPSWSSFRGRSVSGSLATRRLVLSVVARPFLRNATQAGTVHPRVLCPPVLRSATRLVHSFSLSRIVRPRRRVRRANTSKRSQPFCRLCRGLRRDNGRPRATGSRRRVRDRYCCTSAPRPAVLRFSRPLYSSTPVHIVVDPFRRDRHSSSGRSSNQPPPRRLSSNSYHVININIAGYQVVHAIYYFVIIWLSIYYLTL